MEGVQGWESRVQFFKVAHSVWRHLSGPSFLSCEMGALQPCSPGPGGLTEGEAGKRWGEWVFRGFSTPLYVRQKRKVPGSQLPRHASRAWDHGDCWKCEKHGLLRYHWGEGLGGPPTSSPPTVCSGCSLGDGNPLALLAKALVARGRGTGARGCELG